MRVMSLSGRGLPGLGPPMAGGAPAPAAWAALPKPVCVWHAAERVYGM